MGRVIEPTQEKKEGKVHYVGWRIEVVKVLTDSGLLNKKGKPVGEVYVPAPVFDDPSVSRFQKGQLVLFFFGDTFYIKCNEPIVIE